MSVEDSWAAIVKWLERAAPKTAALIQPPLGADALTETVSAYPNGWPTDLRRWYQLHGGAPSPEYFSGVLPGMAEVLSLTDMVGTSRMYAEMYANTYADEEVLEKQKDAAAEPTHIFLPGFVPIATSGTGVTLFVDTRSGSASGCVAEFDKVDAYYSSPSWVSAREMLADTADALHGLRPVDGWQPVLESGSLMWEPA